MLLIGTALILLALNRVDPALVENLRSGTSDTTAPILSFLGQPLVSLREDIDNLAHLRGIYDENRILAENNRRLISWRDTALRLEAENAALRSQLHVAPDPVVRRITARVIGDPAGGFVQSSLLAAGTLDGVEKGQPAVTQAGEVQGGVVSQAVLGALTGRIIQTGDHTARMLLITDVNSRIPVLLDHSHVHAILSGDNSDRPLLMFLPPGATISVGERVVTSGNDRLLPPGLAVGVVVSNDADGIRVAPLADLTRLDFVSVLNYQGATPLPAPELPPVQKPKHRK